MDNLPAGGGGGGGGGVYPDSVESSPRSRGGGSEQWDDLFPSSAAPAKLRFMCSYGGQIVPRPHDRALCYLGGDTRIVAVDRHATLADLSAKLSRSLLGGRPFSLKYQLPSEDLDSLISVTTDEDLDNMIEEYDRVSASGSGSGSSHGGGAGKVSRLRLFLFPAMSVESNSSSMGSLLDDSKSEIWFVDALNGAIGMGGVIPRAPNSAASSVNCLLGLENDHLSSVAAAANNAGAPLNPNSEQSSLPRPDSSGKMTAMPESQMMDKSSSFGSASSAATPSHLPPIRVRPADLEPDQRLACGDMEDRFSQLSVSMQKQEEGFKDGGFVAQDNYYHQHPPGDPSPLCAAAASTTTTNISSTDNPSLSGSLFSTEDENSFHGGAGGALPQPLHHHQQQQQQQLDSFELPTSDRAVYYQEKTSPVTADMNPVSDAKQNGNHQVFDPNLRVQMQVAEQGYMLAMQSEQLQQQNQHQHHHQQLQQQQQQLQQQQQQQQLQQQQLQQQQYVHVNPQLMQHHPSSPMVPIQSYYQMHQPLQAQPQLRQTGPYNQQIPVYYMQPRAPAGYSITMQQPNPIPVPSSTSMTVPFHNAVLPTQGPTSPPMAELGAAAANIYRTSTPAAAAANIYRTSTPAAAAAQPPPIPQQINLTGQSHPYVGYQTMHLHPSQSPAAAASYGYDFPNSVCTQPMYYTQGTSSSAPVPSHYQTVTSSAATVISDLHPQLQ